MKTGTMKHETVSALTITLSMVAASLFGLTEQLGAHPWWAAKTGVIGSTGGLAVYAALRGLGLRPLPLAAMAAAAAVVSGYAAVQGKALFTASFAENTIAGRFWFFGWFGVMAGICALLCSLAARALRR